MEDKISLEFFSFDLINFVRFCFYLHYIHHIIATATATITATAVAVIVVAVVDCFPMVDCYLNCLSYVILRCETCSNRCAFL